MAEVVAPPTDAGGQPIVAKRPPSAGRRAAPAPAPAAAACADVAEPAELSLIETRHCTHRFDKDRPVPRSAIHAILRAARNVPSTNNSQPWTVIVCQGEKRDKLRAGMLEKFDAGDDGKADYKNRPGDMPERMKNNVNKYGEEYYGGYYGLTDQKDKVERRKKYRVNYELGEAPVHLILCCPAVAVEGTYLDMGSIMTGILLGIHMYGMGGKPQFSVAKYHDVCRSVLGKDVLPDDLHVVCGISMGWPLENADPRKTPGFFPTRMAVDDTTKWAVDDTFTMPAPAAAEPAATEPAAAAAAPPGGEPAAAATEPAAAATEPAAAP